jgi:hypothetical protein
MDYFIGKYLTLVGHVQSGKTIEEINYCFASNYNYNVPVIFIVRNIIADQLQLMFRIHAFNATSSKKINIKILNNLDITSAVDVLQQNGVIILLCNHHQLQKIKKVLVVYRGDYNLCIDEVDFSIKSKNMESITDILLADIKSGANHILGATATPFALFLNEKSINVFKKLKPSKNYRGIETVIVNYVEPCIDITFPSSDSPAIDEIYSKLSLKKKCVLLHTTVKEKKRHLLLQDYITLHFPNFITIIYNGDGIFVKGISNKKLIKPKSVNDYGQVINKYYQINDGHLFINFKISEVLQLLVEYSHISIIAGHLASRGISFVSSDYSLHLTDQYFHPGAQCHGENLLQSLRILGCYSDTSNLTLWCKKNTWKYIIEQNELINKMVDACDNSHEWLINIQQVMVQKPSKGLTRPKLSSGINWNNNNININ